MLRCTFPRKEKESIEVTLVQAKECNAKIRGWIAYYGHYYYSALYKILEYIDYRLTLWASHKFKRLKGRQRKAKAWLNEVIEREPTLFAYWRHKRAKVNQ